MKVNKGFLLGVAVGILMGLPGTAHAATWVDTYCSNGAPGSLSSWTRANAATYVYAADNEGYQWGGGCYDDDNRDDSPGHPTQQVGTEGEGTDCSGLVYKTWSLKTSNVSGFSSWARMNYEHGPNNSNSYMTGKWANGSTAVEFRVLGSKGRSYTDRMDAFAKTTHIGLIYTDDGTSDGQDHIIESYNERDGTDFTVRNYRSDAAYKGVARKNWTPNEQYCHMCA